jgi:hypothetical protein
MTPPMPASSAALAIRTRSTTDPALLGLSSLSSLTANETGDPPKTVAWMVDEGVLVRPPGQVVVMADVKRSAVEQARHRLALRNQLGLGAMDEVGKVAVATDIDL